MELIKWMLTEHYKLNLHTITPARGGWSADAYIAQTAERAYFVKVYNKRRVSVRPWIDRMDLYLPVVLWLYHNTPLRDRMTAPIRTASQRYKAENEHCVLLVFPMLDGVTLGDTPMSPGQARQLAQLLAQLHTYGGGIPVPTRAIREDYSLSFLQELAALLQTGQAPATLQTVLDLHADKLLKAIEILHQLAADLQKNRPCEVLCHTDLHGWNLMWTNKLVLVDWEGLRLAPAEADLFTFTDGFFSTMPKKRGCQPTKISEKTTHKTKRPCSFTVCAADWRILQSLRTAWQTTPFPRWTGRRPYNTWNRSAAHYTQCCNKQSPRPVICYKLGEWHVFYLKLGLAQPIFF